MLEFIPFNPFPLQQKSSIDLNHQEDQISDQSSRSSTTQHQTFESNQTSIISKKSRKVDSSSSEQHNMVKQMIITIKNMMGNHIENIGSHSQTKKIIKRVWSIFTNIKNPNKEILKAMFNKKLDYKSLKKLNMLNLVNDFGEKSYQDAMNDLKQEITMRMKGESIKSHLLDRNIKKKDRLAAYILYFIEEQLSNQEICYRFGLKASQKIEGLMTKMQQQQRFIDEFLQNSSEVPKAHF